MIVLVSTTSLTRPPLFGLLSNLTSSHEQGATLGVAQGAGSLARILGPIFATTTLHYLPPLPYLTCTAVLLVTARPDAARARRQFPPPQAPRPKVESERAKPASWR